MLLAPSPGLQGRLDAGIEQEVLASEVPAQRGEGRGEPEGVAENGMADGRRLGMRAQEARTAGEAAAEGVRNGRSLNAVSDQFDFACCLAYASDGLVLPPIR